jgi:RNA polymerase sigma factor (sigma-70 family)
MTRDDLPAAADPPQHADNAALVARCIAGDATAWTQLVHRYQRLIYAIAVRAGLDEHAAADVFQTVFARLVENLPRIDDPSRLQAWIVTTTRRETLRQLRESTGAVSMTRPGDEHDGPSEWDVADDSAIAEEMIAELQQLDLLRAAMEQLDERSRALMLMLFRDDDERLSYHEVAQRLDLPVGSIGPTRARCLAKLRRLMGAG